MKVVKALCHLLGLGVSDGHSDFTYYSQWWLQTLRRLMADLGSPQVVGSLLYSFVSFSFLSFFFVKPCGLGGKKE